MLDRRAKCRVNSQRPRNATPHSAMPGHLSASSWTGTTITVRIPGGSLHTPANIHFRPSTVVANQSSETLTSARAQTPTASTPPPTPKSLPRPVRYGLTNPRKTLKNGTISTSRPAPVGTARRETFPPFRERVGQECQRRRACHCSCKPCNALLISSISALTERPPRIRLLSRTAGHQCQSLICTSCGAAAPVPVSTRDFRLIRNSARFVLQWEATAGDAQGCFIKCESLPRSGIGRAVLNDVVRLDCRSGPSVR